MYASGSTVSRPPKEAPYGGSVSSERLVETDSSISISVAMYRIVPSRASPGYLDRCRSLAVTVDSGVLVRFGVTDSPERGTRGGPWESSCKSFSNDEDPEGEPICAMLDVQSVDPSISPGRRSPLYRACPGWLLPRET